MGSQFNTPASGSRQEGQTSKMLFKLRNINGRDTLPDYKTTGGP